MPAKLRPARRKDDVLCAWNFDFIRDVDNNELGAGSFGTSAVRCAMFTVADTEQLCDIHHGNLQYFFCDIYLVSLTACGSF